ncbi:MAG: M23 family peptidase [Nautilia sp.]|nr:MAG: M23 family peptidase [Nautilia sp.]
MKNSTLITITTLRGSKQYTISQLIKKFIIFFSIFLIFLFIGGFFIISYLNSLVDEKSELLKKKETSIQKILKKQKDLKYKISILEKNISTKQKLLDEVNDKISDIENILQINPPKHIGVNEKLDLAKIDATMKKYILQNIPNGYPIKYMGISSKFGWRKHPILHKREFHPGIDLRAKMKTPIYATADAIVEYANYHKTSGYGRLIILDHNFGFKTLFGHLNKIVVHTGDFVKKGDLIGYTGNSGLSNGPHLHYEVRYVGMVLNPLPFLKWNLRNYNKIFKKEKKIKWQSLIKAIKWQKRLLQQ